MTENNAEHHLHELLRLTQPWPGATIPCATVRSHVEQALSKLRAPVADEPITNEMIQAGAKAAREYFEENGGNSPVVIYKAMRAVALASAPVAGEAVGYSTGIQWRPRQSEQSIKLTRTAQPEYGFDHALYTAPQASEADAMRQAVKTCGTKVIKALAAIAHADGPDTRKADDPQLIYREPVMDEVVRIRQAYDELSAALSAQPGAQPPHPKQHNDGGAA